MKSASNWAGYPLETFELTINDINTTTTGLSVWALRITKTYETGIKSSDEQMEALNLTKNRHQPRWNYAVSPTANKEVLLGQPLVWPVLEERCC